MFVPYKPGGPEAATQVATRLTKLGKHTYTWPAAALPKPGDTHGYVHSQVDAPDERWVYDFYHQTHKSPRKTTQEIEQSVTSYTMSGDDSTSSSHSVEVCMYCTDMPVAIRISRNVGKLCACACR